MEVSKLITKFGVINNPAKNTTKAILLQPSRAKNIINSAKNEVEGITLEQGRAIIASFKPFLGKSDVMIEPRINFNVANYKRSNVTAL